MERLNLISFIFLVVVFVLMPRAALRSARYLRTARATGVPIPRTRIALSTMFSLIVLGALAAINAEALGRIPFDVSGVGARDALLGVAAFALLLGAIPLSRRLHTPEERRHKLANSLAPRTPAEYGVFALIAVLAGLAEELAYRGVAVWILTPIFGSAMPAVFLAAMAFAVSHAVQGGKAMTVVFAIALIFHALVWLTGTLVIAMAVHVAYDLVAGHAAALEVRRLAAAGEPVDEPAEPPASPTPA